MRESKALLKINLGKILNNGLNLGAISKAAKEINAQILEELNVILLNNNNIEYCVDIYTDFNLVDNKHILKNFLRALEIPKY